MSLLDAMTPIVRGKCGVCGTCRNLWVSEMTGDGPVACAHADQLEARPPDHVLLNLPADSMTLLPALRTLHGTAAAPLVHCYTFSKLAGAEEQRCEAHRRVAAHLGHAPAHVDVRAIRSVAPGKEYLCYTFGLQ